MRRLRDRPPRTLFRGAELPRLMTLAVMHGVWGLLTDLASEPEYVFEEYGKDARNPGTYAANCLLARRLAERGVRFIQLYHQGWDQHSGLPAAIGTQCRETDRASAALVNDLKRRDRKSVV